MKPKQLKIQRKYKGSYLGNIRVNLQIVEKDLVCSKGIQELYPLSKPDTEIILRKIQTLDTHSKLLLLSLWLVVDHTKVARGDITLVFYNGH